MKIYRGLGVAPSIMHPGSFYLFNEKGQEKRFEYKKGLVMPRMGAEFTRDEVDHIIKYFKN